MKRCYTTRGKRAHYLNPENGWTFCNRPAIELARIPESRRHSLAEASVCARCDKAQNAMDLR